MADRPDTLAPDEQLKRTYEIALDQGYTLPFSERVNERRIFYGALDELLRLLEQRTQERDDTDVRSRTFEATARFHAKRVRELEATLRRIEDESGEPWIRRLVAEVLPEDT